MEKLDLLKLFQQWGWGGEIKENDGGGKFKYDIFDILSELFKCHNVPISSTAIKKIACVHFSALRKLPTYPLFSEHARDYTASTCVPDCHPNFYITPK
jgi:hypothetical protein